MTPQLYAVPRFEKINILPSACYLVLLLGACPVEGGEEGGVPAWGGGGEEGRRTQDLGLGKEGEYSVDEY